MSVAEDRAFLRVYDGTALVIDAARVRAIVDARAFEGRTVRLSEAVGMSAATTPRHRVVVVESDGGPLAVLTERVDGLLRVAEGAVLPLSPLVTRALPALTALVVHDGGHSLLVATDRLAHAQPEEVSR